MRLDAAALTRLDEAIGEGEYGGAFLKVSGPRDGIASPVDAPEDLMTVDLREGRYVEVHAVTMVDDDKLSQLEGEGEHLDPKDWPTMDGFFVQEIGRALPGYVSGGEYFPTLTDVFEYLAERDIPAAVSSDQWFALVFADEEARP